MNQISVPYSAGGSQALGVASAEQRLLAALLREPSYIPQVRAQLSPDKFLLPQQRELYQAMLDCQQQGVEVSLSTLHGFVQGEEALNELSRLAAQYSDVNCTPEDIGFYLDRIARGTPMANKAAQMSNEDLERYLQSMREKNRAAPLRKTELLPFLPAGVGRRRNYAENVANRGIGKDLGGSCPAAHPDAGTGQPCDGRAGL